jgi:hypothetical protein
MREVSPCICAKARFALGLSGYEPRNSKTCSKNYWAEVVTYFGSLYNLSSETIQRAIDKKYLYRSSPIR